MPKILLVEDNEMNRDMLSRRLARKGYDVVIAVDGEEGVAMAKSESPDLILMDISLPKIDGWEATRHADRFTAGFAMSSFGCATAEDRMISWKTSFPPSRDP